MFDTKKFIAEVKKRKLIYDFKCRQYNDHKAKLNAWKEISRAMIPNWDDLTNDEKTTEEKNLRKKWRNIRDYFMKELKLQGTGKSTTRYGRKRNRYSYYNHLLFLMPSMKPKQLANCKNDASSIEALKTEVEIDEDINAIENSNHGVEEYSLTGISLTTSEANTELYQHQSAVCEASLASFDNEPPADVLSSGHGSQRAFPADDDYDKMFLLSLLPSLRRVPEHMKLHVRIQMQQVLASAFHTNNHHSE